MGFPIPVKWQIYIEPGPRGQHSTGPVREAKFVRRRMGPARDYVTQALLRSKSRQLYYLFNSSLSSQQRKHRSSALLALCGGMQRWLIYSGHKGTASLYDLNPKLHLSPSGEEFICNTHYRYYTYILRTCSIYQSAPRWIRSCEFYSEL